MFKTLRQNFAIKLTDWLVNNDRGQDGPSAYFDRLRDDIKAGDVLLVEGRSRISPIIRAFTASRWTHCALYIGRLAEIEDVETRKRLRSFYRGGPNQQLVIEAEIGKGTTVTPLSHYRQHNLQLCRPKTLSPKQRQKAIDHVINKIGIAYDLKLLFMLGLALFWQRMFPWNPWHDPLSRRSTPPERTICTQLIWEAMNSVHLPVLPFDAGPARSNPQWAKTGTLPLTPNIFLCSAYFRTSHYSHWSKHTECIHSPALASPFLAQIPTKL